MVKYVLKVLFDLELDNLNIPIAENNCEKYQRIHYCLHYNRSLPCPDFIHALRKLMIS